MNFNLKTIILLLLVISTSCKSKSEINVVDNAKYINPFICTSDDQGQTDVAAAIPFGMIKPCPDTYPISHSGYDYSAKDLLGFSHTRFSGVGCRGVGGNIRVLPTIADTLTVMVGMNKESEVAKPGYYAVSLNNGVDVELTATNDVAFHKYLFPKSDNSKFIIDLASSYAGHIAESHSLEEGILVGKVNSVNVCRLGKYSFYYAIKIDKEYKVKELGDSKVEISFSTLKDDTVSMQCALSTIGIDQAKAKLKRSSNMSFESVKEAAYDKWNNLAGVVNVETDNDILKTLFYTHLYHATQSPFIINEEDGLYRASDGEVYYSSNDAHYHGWSIWDTFRSKLPLISFLYPNRFSDIMCSMKELYKHGKPVWGTETEPFITVRTEHSILMMLDAYNKGMLNFSLEEIYPFMQQEAENLPFISPDNHLESCYDLWAMSEIAKILNKEEDAKKYLSKAMEYEKIWKKVFMNINEKSDIMHGEGVYEGTIWQYRCFVPFDISGIQKLLGGKDIFESQLDYFFDNELFNIGNQPDIQVPYLFAYTGSPWKTQKIIHTLLNEETNNWYGTHEKFKEPIRRKIFKATSDGYIKEMDDDAGTMSAWYVWSTLGLFPVFPGTTDLVIGAPQFSKVAINLGEKTLTIIANRESKDDIFIKSVTWNGKEHNSPFIDFNELVKGGELIINLAKEPNKEWGLKN